MSRPRVYADAAAKQHAYRQRLQVRRREAQGPTDRELGRAIRDLHIRLEYIAAVTPSALASQLVGNNALTTFRNTVAHLFATEGF